MSDGKVNELLSRYTPKQLARAYLKASRARNKAERQVKELQAVALAKAQLDEVMKRYGV